MWVKNNEVNKKEKGINSRMRKLGVLADRKQCSLVCRTTGREEGELEMCEKEFK